MKNRFLLWLLALLPWCIPDVSHAVNCYKDVLRGPVVVKDVLPPNIYVSSSMADGTVLWRSDQITYNIACESPKAVPSEEIYAWIYPYRKEPMKGVAIGIMYNGAPTITGKVNTGFRTENRRANFVMTYSLVLIKTGVVPSSGLVNITDYPVFQLDGEGGINSATDKNLMQYINGVVNYSGGGTCSLAAGDVNRTVYLPRTKPADLAPVGKSAGKTPFTLTVNNCTAGTNTAQFTFEGTPDPANPSVFANTGTAKGVAVNLGSVDDDTTIRADGTNNLKIARVQGGSGVLNLYAQYVATGEVQAGTVNSKITMNITYQ
ncbi:fimbrial protein [Achromobacter spanius]|uniref:fimbrial protein n=1 Tax=Achromobacter spanius TaxID=217203 RepID=UPI003827E1C5